MTKRDEEGEKLRTVALQNAQSILQARRRAEEALHAQSEWLRVTLASIGDAVISTDGTGRVTFMNRAAEALTGYSHAESLGRPLSEVFRIVNERSRQAVDDPAERALREGRIVGLANHTLLIARDGTERAIDDSAAPMRDDSGATIGAVVVFRDVTERKRAEADRALLAAIVNSSDDAIVSKTLEGIITSWNKGAERLFGYTRQEAVGQSITLIIPPERHDEESMILQRIRRGQPIEHFETVRVTKDGRRLDISLMISPVRDSEGQIIGASKIARDVTERRRAAQALGESNERARLALEIARVGTWRWDSASGDLKADARTREVLGLGAEEALTLTETLGRVHPEDRPRVEAGFKTALVPEGEAVYSEELRLLRPNGSVRWVVSRARTLFEGEGSERKPKAMIGTVLDVTDRKLDELRLARLLEGEREHGRLLQHVADAGLNIHSAGTLDSVVHVVAEESRRILGAGAAAVRLSGGGDLQTAASAVAVSPQGHADASASVGAIAAEVCKTNRAMRLTGAEYERRRQAEHAEQAGDGTAPHSWLAAPLVGRGGKNIGLIEVFSKNAGDFTDSDEAVLVQLAHIASVAIENTRLYGELRDQDRRKDEFIALLAHELRNPLAPIRNGLQVMRLAAGDATAVAQARTMMERQMGHMVRLIDDLLDISRISRNKMELRKSSVLLADVVANAVEIARPLIEAAELQLTVSLPAEPVFIDGDLTRLAQVFGNLLTNSAKYTERGGGIWLTAERRQREIVVSVRDTGIGIPADALPRIFDMFSQVDRSIERSAGGLGIGLALVKGLVEMHGGSVEAASPGLGKGSTFTVRLPAPAKSLPAGAGANSQEAPPIARDKLRVLVVDDSRDSAKSMAAMLKLLGDEVATAHDGVEALEVAERFRPQAILMDMGMPRLNGYEATRRIRAKPWGKDVTVIAVTGWGQDADRLQSQDAGCDGHLVKPVGLPELEKVLGSLHRKHG